MSNINAPRSRYRTQIVEVINRQRLIAIALEKGYNAFVPVYDGGIDFILYREDGAGGPADLRKIQLKGRWYIDKKYIGRDIWIAFNEDDHWYVVPHDELVAQGELTGFTKSKSWTGGGAYSCPRLSADMINTLKPRRFS